MSKTLLRVVEEMARGGATAEMIVIAVRAHVLAGEDALEKRRISDAARQSAKRDRERNVNHVISRDTSVTVPSRARVVNSSSSLHSEGKKEETSSLRKLDETPDQFSIWYSGYPHKVQRGAAERAFASALRMQGVTLDVLIDGLERYVRSKPPDHAWRNPATWLNGKGWLDKPAIVEIFNANGRQNETLVSAGLKLVEQAECRERERSRLDDMFRIGSG